MASPWEFGWEALVAIGTISLALATYWVARTTRTVARADLANLSAQWRPMLVPYGDPIFTADAETGQWTGEIEVQNRGRGPALFIRTTLEPPNYSPDHWSLGAISPGEHRTLRFSNIGARNLNYQLLLDYRDLSGRLYSSAMVVDFPNDDPNTPRVSRGRFYDVKLFEDNAVTKLGDSAPQEGLTRVGPTPKQRFARLRGAVSGARQGFREPPSSGS